MTYAPSTRGAPPVPFAEALRRGLAPDGGLYLPASLLEAGRDPLPTRWDRGTTAADGAEGSFSGTALRMGRSVLGEEGGDWLEPVVRDALDFPVPLTSWGDGLHVLELHHGPTLAFKDVGARFLARALAALDRKEGGGVHDGVPPRTVLVATSGDTGGAVADAFHGVPGYRVVALFPRDGISERQRRQMTTLGGNVRALAVDGTFDDCQRLTKEAFADPEVRTIRRLTSANSINLGRLLPQAFYYGRAAEQLPTDEPPTWIVPSGNLGNLCAGLVAARLGVPAVRFIAGLNRNRVFLDYLRTGRVEASPSIPTASTAMDVGDPSNLERLRALYGDDATAMARDVGAVSVDDARTYAMVRRVHRERGVFVDPHTAVGLVAWEDAGSPRPAVVLSTAHPAKFPEQVRKATGHESPVPDRLARVLDRPERHRSMTAEYRDFRRYLMEEDGG